VDKPLEKVLRGQMDSEYFPVALGDMAAAITVHEIREPTFDVAEFKIRARFVNHPGVTMAYRIEIGGQVITYATDIEPYRALLDDGDANGKRAEYGRQRDAELIDLVRDADLYIADSQYSPEEYLKKRGWGHSCYLDAVDLAMEANAKCVALFSHDPMHDDDAVDRKLAECTARVQAAGSSLKVLAAAESKVVELDLKD
jgi:ribonuclease BN (tRNA processing enzyme)